MSNRNHAAPETRYDTLIEEGAALAAHGQPTTVHKSVIVIGAGQAGLSMGYHLQRLGINDYIILDGARRVGDSWRHRWDSLRLFTPSLYDGLDGLKFPGCRSDHPTKDEMADYLESYAAHFSLPVLGGARVECLTREGGLFHVRAAGRHYSADQVVVAMSNYQVPRVPTFAAALGPRIRQFHASDYRKPEQLAAGDVLIAGAGNSGAEIAWDIGRRHRIFMAGPSTGQVPGRFGDFVNRNIVVHVLARLVFPHIMSVSNPLGRKARPKVMKSGVPLIRIKSRDLEAIGVARTGRVVGAKDELPLLEDGTTRDVANVIWCTGFAPDFSWIRLPVLLDDGEPNHRRGSSPAHRASTSSACTSLHPWPRPWSTVSVATLGASQSISRRASPVGAQVTACLIREIFRTRYFDVKKVRSTLPLSPIRQTKRSGLPVTVPRLI